MIFCVDGWIRTVTYKDRQINRDVSEIQRSTTGNEPKRRGQMQFIRGRGSKADVCPADDRDVVNIRQQTTMETTTMVDIRTFGAHYQTAI